MVVKSVVPKVAKNSAMPSESPMSPTRLRTKAFLAAAAAECLYCQKPISRYDARPTPSQPRKSAEVVGREHQHEHRGDEQVEVAEEPAPARVVLHVADRVDVDQRPDAGDQQQEQRRQRVVEQVGADVQAAGLEPRAQVLADLTVVARRGRAARRTARGEHERADGSGACRAGGRTCRAVAASGPPSSRITAPSSGQRDHQPEQGEHAVGRRRVDHGDVAVAAGVTNIRFRLLSTSAGWRRRPRPSGGCGRWS